MTRASPACDVYAVTGPNAAKLWNSPTCCPYQIWKSGRFGNFSVRKICLLPKLGYRTCLNCIRITWVCLKLRGNDFQGCFFVFFRLVSGYKGAFGWPARAAHAPRWLASVGFEAHLIIIFFDVKGLFFSCGHFEP